MSPTGRQPAPEGRPAGRREPAPEGRPAGRREPAPEGRPAGRRESTPEGRREVRIEKLVPGGEGLARVDGEVVLVPLSAPGDRLEIEEPRRSGGVARARISRILAPSPLRAEPACAHFGDCGGCRLQHLRYEAQLEAKAGFVREALRRIGGITWEGPIEVRSGPPLGWRARAELQIDRDPGGRARVGFFRARSRDLCEIEDCPVLAPGLRAELARLRSDPGLLPRGARSLALASDDDGAVARGSGTVLRRVAGLRLRFAADSFSQGNQPLLSELVSAATAGESGGRALDLYAGAGLFALALARSFASVEAVESDPAAAALGIANARENGIANARFTAARVEDWLRGDSARGPRPDLLLLDPPRVGAGKRVVAGIAELAPRRITYVSCNPATLARDLRGFAGQGYRPTAILALDLFPQTAEVEVVARLEPAAA